MQITASSIDEFKKIEDELNKLPKEFLKKFNTAVKNIAGSIEMTAEWLMLYYNDRFIVPEILNVAGVSISEKITKDVIENQPKETKSYDITITCYLGETTLLLKFPGRNSAALNFFFASNRLYKGDKDAESNQKSN
jgi:hypothetical protein